MREYNMHHFANCVIVGMGNRTKKEFAKESGLSREFITRICNEKVTTKPSKSTVRAIAEHMDTCMTLHELSRAAGYEIRDLYVAGILKESDIPEHIFSEINIAEIKNGLQEFLDKKQMDLYEVVEMTQMLYSAADTVLYLPADTSAENLLITAKTTFGRHIEKAYYLINTKERSVSTKLKDIRPYLEKETLKYLEILEDNSPTGAPEDFVRYTAAKLPNTSPKTAQINAFMEVYKEMVGDTRNNAFRGDFEGKEVSPEYVRGVKDVMMFIASKTTKEVQSQFVKLFENNAERTVKKEEKCADFDYASRLCSCFERVGSLEGVHAEEDGDISIKGKNVNDYLVPLQLARMMEKGDVEISIKKDEKNSYLRRLLSEK